MFTEADELNQASTGEKTSKLGSGVYVDVENLQGVAREIIKELLASWPEGIPIPSRLNVYVRADQTLLWNMWAESQFPDISVAAKGIQHFSNTPTKNSADIVLAIDAITDILLGRISYVVVLSDDSDFISLFTKVRDEQDQIGYAPGKVPFLWVLTDRNGTRSSTIKDYFPNNHFHSVHFPKITSDLPNASETNVPLERPVPPKERNNPFEDMAQAIIEQIPVGMFKSAKCWEIIRVGWSSHPIVTDSKVSKNRSATFGDRFMKDIFPILQRRGVVKKSQGYEMTQRVKDSAW